MGSLADCRNMKIVLAVLFLAAVYRSEAARKCVVGKDGSAEEKACTDAQETTCSGPIFNNYSGFTAGEWKCGACAGTTDGCNKAPVTDATFKCHDYTYKTDKFVANAAS